MVLYLKAGPHGEGIGDCPFAQYARMILEEKGISYELKPCTLYNKPQWLIDEYDGALPALRHGDQSYVESQVIAQYIDFFFSEGSLSPYGAADIRSAKDASNAIFPALARYLTHLPDGDEDDKKLRSGLENALQRLEDYLLHQNAVGPYLVGDGKHYCLVDASLTPKLYHMWVGINEFKKLSTKEMSRKFPRVYKYIKALMTRPSFLKTRPKQTIVIWGWTNARSK